MNSGDNNIQLFVLAIGPSLFWLWWFWSQENGQRQGIQKLARAFVFGALSVIPGTCAEYVLAGASTLPNLIECCFVVGPIEELCKLAATWFAVARDDSFDKPADGIVYAAAASLGFAFAENLYYFASMNSHTFVVRAGLSVPMHVLEAVPWAVALGRIRCDDTAPRRILFSGFVIASILHGVFDSVCFQIRDPHDIALIVLFVLSLLEWRLYVLSMREMLRLGRRLIQRRMFSSSRLRKEPVVSERFSWFWFVLPAVLSFLTCCGVWAALRYLAPQMDVVVPMQTDLAVVSILMIVLGIIVAYRSPGHTIRESALALALSGFSISFVASWPGVNPLESGVYFAALGAFGSWLGEMLQDEEIHRTLPQLDALP
jgi:protease PrsW